MTQAVQRSLECVALKGLYNDMIADFFWVHRENVTNSHREIFLHCLDMNSLLALKYLDKYKYNVEKNDNMVKYLHCN